MPSSLTSPSAVEGRASTLRTRSTGGRSERSSALASSLARTSRATGAAYLGIVASGIFAEFFVRGSLVVAGDATLTAAQIAERPGFFGLGVGADVVMIALDVFVAFGLYRLLRRVDRRLALAATVFRLVQASVLVVNLGNLIRAGTLSYDPSRAADTLAAMETHALVYDVALIAFGLACVTLGPLLRRAGAPLALASGLALTGGVYLVGSFAALFAPALLATIDPLYGIAILVEPSVAVWLIVRARRWS